MRTAWIHELAWIEHLQARHLSNQIGFVPRAAYADRLDRGDLLHLAWDNDDAGFILVGAGRRSPLRISQLAVHPDLWSNGIGKQCIAWILAHGATLPRGDSIIADVRQDLVAMQHACLATGAAVQATTTTDTARGIPVDRLIWRPQGQHEGQVVGLPELTRGTA